MSMSEMALAQDERCEHVARARSIARSLGAFTAARYLYLRGWTLEAALYIITRHARRAP